MIERLETGRRMSKIVKHNGVAYLCGQVGDGDTVAEQTGDCLARIDALLDQAGSDREHILQATIWLADMADFSEMNAVWDAWVPDGHAPARLRRSPFGKGRAQGGNHHRGGNKELERRP